jgi:hypothetical protein
VPFVEDLDTHGTIVDRPTAWGALDGLIVEEYDSQSELESLNNTSPPTTPSLSRPPSQHVQQRGDQRKAHVNATAWKGRFDTPSAREAVKLIRQALHKVSGRDSTNNNINASSVGLRWLAYHSHLGESDGILLLAKSTHDLEAKLASIAQGPLPEELVSVIEEAGRRILK